METSLKAASQGEPDNCSKTQGKEKHIKDL